MLRDRDAREISGRVAYKTKVMPIDLSSAIDEIYEAAVLPEGWTRVLDRLAEVSGAEGTFLFASDAERSQWMCSPALQPYVAAWFSSDWTERNARRQRLIPIREPRFLTDLDAFTLEEIEREPYYQEFLKPLGMGWCAGTTIRTPAGDTLVFTAERLHRKGPVERSAVRTLDRLRPHLARAAVLSARVGLERARATVEALQTIGLPAVVLGPTGRAVAANEAFRTVPPALAIGAGDRLHFSDGGADALFLDALRSLDLTPSEATGFSIPIAGEGVRPPMVAHLLPLRRLARDLFSGATSLLFVTPVIRSKAPDVGLLEALFDLTPAEAKVASLLVEGCSVETIAAVQDVTANTVRQQLKSVFAKTGVGRQAELVSLLSLPSYTPPRTP
jgi:DNA-binding CsgD family transcriptional regulator